jgi:hypothetical protein
VKKKIKLPPINIFFGEKKIMMSPINIFFVKKKIMMSPINIFFGEKKIKLFVAQAGMSVVRIAPATKQLFPLHLIH